MEHRGRGRPVPDAAGGVAGGARLPGRVRDAIQRQQDASERLIAWIQLGVLLTFAVLYAVAPKTSQLDPWSTPVAMALVAYFAFSLLRLWLAYRICLPGWFLMLSVVADLGLLMVLIWSFHIQYDQPASFYLKAPTLLYVFIFIALRALRFEAKYVLLAGGVAAAGWLVLVAYVVTIDPADNMITRDYVAYMTGNAILVGAEFDKVMSILTVTGILALALTRARRLLERQVVEAQAVQDLSRFFSPEIADRITRSDRRIRPGEGEARDAAILFVDIRGFTALSEMLDPTQLIRLLSEYEALIVPVVQRRGGNIDKFLGDGILATFGAVLPTESYAADALRAAEEIVGAVEGWTAQRLARAAQPVAVGVAVATGPVVFGAVGDETRLEYTVIGEAVNTCAKLEKHNRAAGTRAVTTAETLRLALSQGYRPAAPVEERRDEQVEGIGQPLHLAILAR